MYDAVNIDGLKLGPVRSSSGASSCKLINILSENGSKLKIQSCVCRIPWDIKLRQMAPDQNVNANMSLSLDTSDENGAKFLDFLQRFDAKVKSLLSTKSKELGKKDGAIEFEFKDSFKESKDGQYPATFQPKIWTNVREGGSPKCLEDVSMNLKVFDMDLQKISPGSLTRGVPCAILVSPSYVWSSSLGVGITWSCSEAVAKPMEVEECGFKMDSSFDQYKTPAAKKRKVESSSETGSVGSVEQDDVESVEEEEEEEEEF